jgi:hypothetical protein
MLDLIFARRENLLLSYPEVYAREIIEEAAK